MSFNSLQNNNINYAGIIMKIRVSARLERRYQKHRELHERLKEHAQDILESERFESTKECIQHDRTTVHQHCVDVAKQSIIISRGLRMKVNEREMVRGALLHDYFLYDWHDKNREGFRRWHGFHHPSTALSNACEEYELTNREKDIIKKHMWPMTIIPPRYKEAWVVTLADKYISTMETLKLRRKSILFTNSTDV